MAFKIITKIIFIISKQKVTCIIFIQENSQIKLELDKIGKKTYKCLQFSDFKNALKILFKF